MTLARTWPSLSLHICCRVARRLGSALKFRPAGRRVSALPALGGVRQAAQNRVWLSRGYQASKPQGSGRGPPSTPPPPCSSTDGAYALLSCWDRLMDEKPGYQPALQPPGQSPTLAAPPDYWPRGWELVPGRASLCWKMDDESASSQPQFLWGRRGRGPGWEPSRRAAGG